MVVRGARHIVKIARNQNHPPITNKDTAQIMYYQDGKQFHITGIIGISPVIRFRLDACNRMSIWQLSKRVTSGQNSGICVLSTLTLRRAIACYRRLQTLQQQFPNRQQTGLVHLTLYKVHHHMPKLSRLRKLARRLNFVSS